jgi:hypothetical protein
MANSNTNKTTNIYQQAAVRRMQLVGLNNNTRFVNKHTRTHTNSLQTTNKHNKSNSTKVSNIYAFYSRAWSLRLTSATARSNAMEEEDERAVSLVVAVDVESEAKDCVAGICIL